MFGKLLGLVVGVGLGLLLQGWVAAVVFGIIGLIAGHKLDDLNAPPLEDLPAAEVSPALGPLPEAKTASEVDAEARLLFAREVANLFVAVATSDGELGRDEVRVVREFFADGMRYSPRELSLVREALKAARDEPAPLDEALQAARAQLSESERLLLLDALYRMALADGDLRRAEREVLREVASGLGLSEEDERSIAGLHLGGGEPHYERLGLLPTASDEEIKRAFRRLAAAHHPDKVAHLGGGAQALASQTFRDLREAYEALRQLRGF